MKPRIELSKKERKLELILILIALLSFIVIGFGIYFENNNIDKDHILIPMVMGIYLIFFGILAFNGLSNGQLIKRWGSIIYVILLWPVTKVVSDKQKAENITSKILSLFATIFCLLILIATFKHLNS